MVSIFIINDMTPKEKKAAYNLVKIGLALELGYVILIE